MAEKAKVELNGKVMEYEVGTPFVDIANDVQDEYDRQIMLFSVNGKLHELHKKLKGDCVLEAQTITSKAGYETYRRSVCLIMLKAINDVYPGDVVERVKIEFSISRGFYCTVRDMTVDDDFVKKVEARMDEIVKDDIPIYKNSYALEDAMKLFRERNMKDKERLFRYRRASRVNIYSIGDYKDYFYGYMAQATGRITKYKLYRYGEGFVVQMPTRRNPDEVPPFEPKDKLFATMCQADEWGLKLGIDTVGALNDRICEGSFQQIMLVQEAIQEGRIAEIVSDIEKHDGVKFVMIAGPSSSGKTTFSYRLSVQLEAHGFKPHPIGLDNYYKNRENCPRDENGELNFECLEALDVEGFNADMKKLLSGEEVEIPTFNFKTGKREYNGNFLKLEEGDILVVEGIHGLNEKMSYALPKESKYKIYICPLTALNIDEHNRIPTTDIRLIRRMVRDNRTRGTKAEGTLAMWDSVRRGEEDYIFPFQESADAYYNSALIYELAVLKQFAEPLLFNIEKSSPHYQEAKRLLKFLEYFLGVSSEGIPNNSILREFVGGSLFNV